MTFVSEAEFEKALIKVLRDKGWGEHDVIKNPTEEQLLENWAKILFENNKGIDRLNNILIHTYFFRSSTLSSFSHGRSKSVLPK